MLLALDSVMLYFVTSMLLKHSYKNLKREICYSYIALVVLCPTLFTKDYLHLELNSLGYSLISFILLILDTGDVLLVSIITGILMNTHWSYIWLIPPIFIAVIKEQYKVLTIKYHNPLMKNGFFAIEITKLVVGFLMTCFVSWIPFLGEPSTALESLARIFYMDLFDHDVVRIF